MNDLDSLMPRVIEQIYAVLAHEIKMGLWDGRDESGGIYSFQFLQSLHEDFMVNLHKLLEMTNFEFDETMNQDKNILSKYLALMNAKKSQLTQSWLTLRHFMIYIYRSLLSLTPQNNAEEMSSHFIDEMKALVKELSTADEIQLYLRIFSLLHQFVSFSYCQFNKTIDKGTTLERLHQYYQTFLLASKTIYPAFMDLEKLLKEKCNMTWMDYNKFVFFNIFYQAIDSEILTKVRQKEKLEVPAEYNSMFIDFGELNTLWQTLKKLRGINQNMDKEMSEDHKWILKNNFWIHRNKTEDTQSIQRLAAELIILASDRRMKNCESYLNSNGQCLCEDCLLCMIALQIDSQKITASFRLLPCRFCPKGIDLNHFHDHVVGHLKRNMTYDVLESPSVKEISDNGNIYKKIEDKENRELKNGEKKNQLLGLLKKVKPTISKTEAKTDNLPNRPLEKKPENNITNGEIKENCRVPYIRNETTAKNSSSCSHSCKHEEELKAELKKLQGVCDHHKDSKRCDCTYCEVFGLTVAPNKKHSNETRTRLRIRLNQRNQKQKNIPVDPTNRITSSKTVAPVKTSPPKFEPAALKENQQQMKTAPTVKTTAKSLESFTNSLKQAPEIMKATIVPTANDHKKLNDIHGLVDYIEGNLGSDKAAIAEKKAAKKARQRQKKEDERKKIEEKKLKEEEEKKKEAELQLRIKQQLQRNLSQEVNKKCKKTKSKNKGNSSKDTTVEDETDKSQFIEETIPAMVTIKRSSDNGDNSPTVTITLKGSTPDQDKLLCTLMNGQTDVSKEKPSNKSKKNKKQPSATPQNKVEHLVKLQVLRKECSNGNNGKCNNSNDKEVKVSFTVNNKPNESSANNKNSDSDKNKIQTKNENAKTKSKELELPFLKLPPGITITKIDGPSANSRNNYRIAMNEVSANTNVPVNNKSGVIVVDTEKLINDSKKETSGRRSRKKKNKKQPSNVNAENTQPSMVTLKNPIFQSLSESVGRQHSLPLDIAGASCGQASIFRNENGMVTIRSSRLQQSINNGIPMHNILSDLKPVIGGEVETPVTSNCVPTPEVPLSSLNAQEILSGLPGIEITKVDKKTPKPDHDLKANQVAQVSIIPTNGDKCNFDKEDWSYDNIFTPKDVLEDDLDAEERELEAFKRFCQQSVPPKQKEKVAHLNVHDIVLKKKNDIYLA